MENYNHLLVKKIASLPYGAFAMKNLKGIRKGRKRKVFNRKISNWSYSQFRTILEYNAHEQGKQVILVNPS